MTITLTPELGAQLEARAAAEGLSVDAYIQMRILENDEWANADLGAPDESDPEFEEVRAAIEESIEQFDRGEGIPAAVVSARLRAKYGIPG